MTTRSFSAVFVLSLALTLVSARAGTAAGDSAGQAPITVDGELLLTPTVEGAATQIASLINR